MSKTKVTKGAISIIENFDTTDLLATLGGINLSFDNQNKNYATSYYSTYILLNQNSGKPRASRKTLNQLVEELNKSGIIYSIQDPPEAPFFQMLSFDRYYGVFNGVDHHAAFFVSRLCELLLFGGEELLPKEFLLLLMRIIKAVLSVSDKIYQSLKPKYDDVMEYSGDQPIFLPSNIEYLKTLLYIDKSDIYQLGLSEEEIQRYLVFHKLPSLNVNKCLEKEIPYYYRRPFLDCGDKLLLIDPTSINTYIRFISVELSELYKCKEQFIDNVNNIFADWGEWCIRKSIMNYAKEDKIFSNFKYTNTPNYKDAIIQFSKNRIIIYSACFDNNLEGKYTKIDVDKYLSSIKKQLHELSNDCDVIHVALCFSYGAGLDVRESAIFRNNNLLLFFDEFESLAINEKHKPCALFNAVNYIHITKHLFLPTTSVINRIAFLHSKDYDFYLDEKADAYNTNIFIGFEFTYHYRVLAAIEETSFIAPFYNQFILLEKDTDNLYYLNNRFFDNSTAITYNRYPNGGVWVYSRQFDYNLVTFIGMVNYWLTKLKELLIKNIDRYFYIKLVFNPNETKIVKVINKTCLLNIAPIVISVNEGKEFDEISLIKEVLNGMGLLLPSANKFLNETSLDPYKRYNTPLSADQLMLIPFKQQLRPVFVSKYHSSLLDDTIGRDYAIDECKLTPGSLVPDPDKFLKGAVTKLFNDLDKYVKEFNWLSAVKFIYEYQEDYLQKLLINKRNFKVKYSLYDDHIEEINQIYYDLNNASPCIRFLVQYFATMQYEGKKEIDECDLEVLIALVNKIIHLANVDDGIVFRLLPNEMTFLKSKRIDIDLTNLETFNKFIAGEMINDLIGENIGLNDNKRWPFNKELNEAYLDEYGFTFDQMSQVIALILAVGQDQESEIKEASIDDIMTRYHEINNPEVMIGEQTILLVINHLSLTKRDIFFDPSIGNFRELYPWRFNRMESITRKPLVKYGDKLIWGNRTLYQCFVFTLDHIYDGSAPTKNHSSGKIKNLNGKVLKLKGERFNDVALDYLSKSMPDIRFIKGVKSFNNKRMTNDKGEFLGDIDILGIDEKKHRIYLIEAKNYQYSKNMAEFGFELNEFIGTPKKKGFVEKQMNRVDWAKNHIDDVKKEYELDNGNWKVLYTFLSDKPLLCSVFGDVSFNNVSISKINKKYLNSLNK